jgi:hypothetical protein
MTKKPAYLSHVLKLLWDAEELKDIFRIEVRQGDAPKLGILVVTDKRAIIILENRPDHKIDFRTTLRIFSIRLTSIIEVSPTETALRVSTKNQGMELFFRYEKTLQVKMNRAYNLLLRKKQETRQLSDIWRQYLKD